MSCNRVLGSVVVVLVFAWVSIGAPIKPIARRIPPKGIQLKANALSDLKRKLAVTTAQFKPISGRESSADIEVYLKAVRLAMDFNEFYKSTDLAKAHRLLDTARKRMHQYNTGKPEWKKATGLVVRGYRSQVDGSVQPYGLVIPESYDGSKPAPLYVWLHGRGDKVTDLHFIDQREKSRGQISPANAIVLHPFGRQCIGYKSAGEIDVLDAIRDVQKNYRIDSDRIVLAGFSMGGAGAWHIGAHYTDRFGAVHAGAGFAETAQYIKLKKADYPPIYEQKLWSIYDVPNYTRNLFNVPVICYSGEKDRQIQAARLMEAAYQKHGRKLKHVIGRGMGHKYHPDSLREVMTFLDAAVKKGRPVWPKKVSLQTRTLRYNRMYWVEALGLEEHYKDSRIDASVVSKKVIEVKTKNITQFRVWTADGSLKTLLVDGQRVVSGSATKLVSRKVKGKVQHGYTLRNHNGKWNLTRPLSAMDAVLAKVPGMQGPIDDAFLSPFLVVTPSQKSIYPRVERWVQFELAHFRSRWRALFRGMLREKQDKDVTDTDLARYNVVVFGDHHSNLLICRLRKMGVLLGGIGLSETEIKLGKNTYGADRHVFLGIYPLNITKRKYVVFNSGPTFREAHDRTNSLQNPKLGDWAIVDVTRDPDASSPGKVIRAGFFDERWQLRKGK